MKRLEGALREKNKKKKRKTRMLERRLTEATRVFPETFYDGVHALKLPAAQAFTDSLGARGIEHLERLLLERATTHLKV